MTVGSGGAGRVFRPEVYARKEALLAGEPAEVSAREFSLREICFLAGCATYSTHPGSILTVRNALSLERDERGSIRMMGRAHVRFVRA